MSVHHLKVAAAVAAIAAFSAAGYADDAADQANPDTKALLEYVKKLESRVTQLETEKEWPLDQVRSQSGSALERAISGMNTSGYLEMQFGHNFRHGGGGFGRGDAINFNRLHGSANDETSFSFQNLDVLVDKPLTTEGSTGFHARGDFGEVSRFDNRDFNFTQPDHAFDVREAYMSWRASFPWWSMTNYVDFSVGKMDSPLGIETPDAPDTANNFGLVTRSAAHDAAMPITHTGIRAVFPWMECAKTSVYFVNGWDNVRDAAGDGKTLIVSHEMGKYEWMNSSLTFNVSYGNEGSAYLGGIAPDGNKTQLGEIIWRGELDADNSVALDGFWASTDHGRFDSTGATGRRHFHGVAGYLRHQWTKESWVSVRAEWYADDAALGSSTTPVTGGPTAAARMWEVSLAVGWDVASDLAVVLEFRHDKATGNSKPFQDTNFKDAIRKQDTLTASFVYRF